MKSMLSLCLGLVARSLLLYYLLTLLVCLVGIGFTFSTGFLRFVTLLNRIRALLNKPRTLELRVYVLGVL